MKNLLVVVDMVNGFLNFGNLADKKIHKITPGVVSIVQKFINEGNQIVAFCDSHTEKSEELKTFPTHCMKGTQESELIDELLPYKDNMTIIQKDTTNGFIEKEFFDFMKANDSFNRVFVVGCCTDICVKDFATSMHKVCNQVIVPAKLVYTFDSDNHPAEVMHEKALDEMERQGIIIVRGRALQCKKDAKEKE